MDMLQLALSRDSDAAEAELAPMFCRVDFINALLSQELINIVAAWQESLPKPPAISGFWRNVRRREPLVHQTIHQLFRLFAAILCLGALAHLLPLSLHSAASLGDAVMLGVWLFGSLMVVDFCETIGHYVAVSALRSLEAYGRYVVLQLAGDDALDADEVLLAAQRKADGTASAVPAV